MCSFAGCLQPAAPDLPACPKCNRKTGVCLDHRGWCPHCSNINTDREDPSKKMRQAPQPSMEDETGPTTTHASSSPPPLSSWSSQQSQPGPTNLGLFGQNMGGMGGSQAPSFPSPSFPFAPLGNPLSHPSSWSSVSNLPTIPPPEPARPQPKPDFFPPPPTSAFGPLGFLAPSQSLFQPLSTSTSRPVPSQLSQSSPASQSLQTLADERANAPPSANVSSSIMCSYPTPARSRVTWVANNADLRLEVPVCKDKTVTLDHSFADMSAHHDFMAEESGVHVRGASTTGPNNALCELRLLLVGADCKTVQVAVRFADEAGQFLLFRSTGGHVLWRNPQNGNAEEVRTHACNANSSAVYGSQETYVQVGCYSFARTQADSTEIQKKQDCETYMREHQGAYRELVKAPSNPQLFHHSEQAVFAMLYRNPRALEAAIKAALEMSGLQAAPQQLVRLAALTLDIFTTRSACNDCCKGASATHGRAEHFFLRAVGMLKGLVSTDGLRTHVRLACQTAFTGCPSSASTPPDLSSSSILHALPQALTGGQVAASGDVTPVLVLVCQIPANQPGCRSLLISGAETPEKIRIYEIIKTHNLIVSPKSSRDILNLIAKMKMDICINFKEAYIYAVDSQRKLDKIYKETQIREIIRSYRRDIRLDERIKLIVFISNIYEKDDQSMINWMVRNYNDLFGGLLIECAECNKATFLNLISSSLKELGTRLQALDEKYDIAIEQVKSEIRAEIAKNTGASISRAVALALDFGLQNELETDAQTNNNTGASTSTSTSTNNNTNNNSTG